MKKSDENHPEILTLGARFERLVAIMAQLRAPGGCPWDREQSYDTIKPYTIEETYEVLEAVDQRDYAGLCEELGDFMLQAVFYAQMAQEEGRFSIADSLDAINEKLVRRHPHIFSDGDAKTSDQVLKRWEEIKAVEKSDRGETPKGCLDGIPRALPALMEGLKISQKVAKKGFEWPDFEQVLEKFHEETAELADARANGTQEQIEGELGDLLFTVVNMARWLKVDPEQALRKTNAKFRARFAHVEQSLAAQGKTLEQSTLEEMEALWQQAKSLPESR
jgi:MazG family protein